jgi:predicted RNase H-like HicB family nuclease
MQTMKNYTFSVLIERDEDGGFVGTVPELIGCSTQGDSIPELLANAREAITVCLEAYEKDGVPAFSKDYLGMTQLEVAV